MPLWLRDVTGHRGPKWYNKNNIYWALIYKDLVTSLYKPQITNTKNANKFYWKIIIKVGNHKNMIYWLKNKPRTCIAPVKYSVNTINKKHLNIQQMQNKS